MPTSHDHSTLYQRPAELLQHLIRFNTTNPPGNEADCISYIHTLLTESGFQTKLLASNPMRPNLVTRLQGSGNAPPLLLQGHVDVVTTEQQQWQQDPFSGAQVDGYIWGRGALDMKGGVAMMLAALLRAKHEHASLPGDVVLALLCDEEAGGTLGAQYLVEQHADLFQDVRYALGEFGGFPLYLGGRRFYLIQVLEKQVCWMQGKVYGRGGHGSLPVRGGAMGKLGQILQRLDQRRLPTHISQVPRQMLAAMAHATEGSVRASLQQLLDPARTDSVLDTLEPSQRILFEPMVHNTVNVTIVRGGNKINVVPGEVAFEMDGRLLPGFTPDDMMLELSQVIGSDAHIKLVRYDQGREKADMTFFPTLVEILRECDPDGVPVPFLTPVVTDGRFFSRLGIQTYGFLPMTLPPGFDFLQTVHAADERVPIEAIEFGTQAIYQALLRNHA